MDSDELLWAGADAQAQALRDGTVSAPALLEAVLRRAGEVNPRLNLFRELYPDTARDAAERAQARLDAGERTPLLGVPVAVKDDTDIAGEVSARGGRAQFPPAEADSPAVAKLRAAGAVIVGHTQMPDRGLWPFTETLAHGATRNPWNPDHTTGGSSGGSAGAVAAGIVGLATGTDGGGSIRIPANFCGIFGLKTTRGLVDMGPDPGNGHWHGLSVLGPLGRRVADAAAMLDVVADEDHAGGFYRDAARTDPEPLRIALSWYAPLGRRPGVEPLRRQAVLETAQRLRALGHEVTEADPPLGLSPSPQFLTRFLRGVSDDVATLPHPEWLEPRTRRAAAMGRRIPDGVLARTLAAEATLDAKLREFFGSYDVLLAPGWTARQPGIGRWHGAGAVHTLGALTNPIAYYPLWNVVGYPAAAVPVSRDERNLPVGVQLVGPARSEHRLLSLAGQLERAHPWTADRPAV
ncbi:amidase [Actinophytocola xinjiangensis]|uniref:Amidase n=1 Tax=Actinophytocola xinjiangensis TaxID=485602 RepID=A0A7Z0WJ87_9PSEU|nr:amidase family protein [Actinophytocola xinjiangensis]OLF08659.1 amidase [Actinophytocola xinjiangensis]